MDQLTLRFDRERSIDERFAEWLRLNPHVLDTFRRSAQRLRDAGHRRYSSRGICEAMRFNRAVVTTRIDDFKINNNWTSRLARVLIDEDPSWADFFETRRLPSREDDECE